MIKSIELPRNTRRRYALLLISIAMFVASLFMRAYTLEGEHVNSWQTGFWCLLMGWLSIFSGAGIAWLANPFLAFSWIAVANRSRHSVWLSLAAVLFSTCFLLIDRVLVNESGSIGSIVSRNAGYYFWLGSAVIICAASFVVWIQEKRQPFIHPHFVDQNQSQEFGARF